MAIICLTEIAKHSEELAQSLLEKEIIPLLENYLQDHNVHLRRAVCGLLGQIAKHSVDKAEQVCMTSESLSKLLLCLQDPDLIVRKNSISCLWEIIRHPAEHVIIWLQKSKGPQMLIEYLWVASEMDKLPALLAIRDLGIHSDKLAEAFLKTKIETKVGEIPAVEILLRCVVNERHQIVRTAAVKTLASLTQLPENTTEATTLVDAGIPAQILTVVSIYIYIYILDARTGYTKRIKG